TPVFGWWAGAARYLGHEARCARRGSRPVPADRHQGARQSRFRGLSSPTRPKGPGIQVSGVFPRLAAMMDKVSLVRSVFHTAAAVHDTGHQMMQSGRLFTGGINTPHAGCALEFLKSRRNELPANIILPEAMGPTGGNMPHGQDAGFLGKAYD